MIDCISELRGKGYDVPLYPSGPSEGREADVKARYARILGSAVNPVLRQGNSDRHVVDMVKEDARRHPSNLIRPWSKASRTHVAYMERGDFYGSERTAVMEGASDVAIELVRSDGTVHILKGNTTLEGGEVIDGSFMDVRELQDYFEREIADARDADVILSLHLKTTMMNVSDPIIFGHCLQAFFKSAFEKHIEVLESVGVRPHDGLKSIFRAIEERLPKDRAEAILADFDRCYDTRPRLAMVDSDRGITNLHVPSDVIVDNSMPIVIRDGGKMWNKHGRLEDTKCLIPDRSYATTYQEVLSYVKTRGQFDPLTMGNICNVGLMADRAEEYGSHDKTFEIPADGAIRVRDNATDRVYLCHDVRKGDVWRMCQTKDRAIRNWVGLAVRRASETGCKTIFWLDPGRSHDAALLPLVRCYLEVR